jgi:Fe-coproporphyrin III synthase
MNRRILGLIQKGMNNPGRIWPYFRRRFSYLAYFFGDGSLAFRPTSIKLYINNRCNARCIMCDIGRGDRDSVFYRQLVQRGENLFSVEACQRLAESVRGFRPSIDISGVEPLMHPDIIELLKILKGDRLPVSLSTNGILLSDLAECLIATGIDSISVSIDGPEPVHDRIRGMGVYRKALDGARNLLKYRDKKGKNTEITCAFCITDLNCRYLLETASAMLDTENFDCINFIHPYFVTPQASERHNSLFESLGHSSPAHLSIDDLKRIDIDALWEQMQILHSRFDSDRFRFNVDLSSREQVNAYYRSQEQVIAYSRCLVPWSRATILANGDMVIHNRCFYYLTGNIFKESFNGVWNGERYRFFRRALKKIGLFPVCARCCGSLLNI